MALLTSRPRTLESPWGDVRLQRAADGAAQIRADDRRARSYGLGVAHGIDRGLQMGVLRAVGRGEAAATLRDTDGLAAQDRMLRERGIALGAARDVAALSGPAADELEAYCAGVATGRAAAAPRPVAALLRIPDEPWTPVDSLTVLRLLAWTSLAQTQEMVERLIIRSAVRGTDHDAAVLRGVFAPWLDGFDRATVRGVTLAEPAVELDPVAAGAVPTWLGSNAWALAGSRTGSGAPIVCNDPHLEGQALPLAFYEASIGGADGGSVGVTVPGLPGVVAGRFGQTAVGVTYAFVDQVDFFVEECRDGRVRRGDRWVELEHRTEEVRRGGSSETIDLWRSDVGLIEGDPRVRGRYLARSWVGDVGTFAAALDVPRALEEAAGLDEALEAVRGMPLPFNYVVGCTDGGIALQQSGLAPLRAEGAHGLAPLAAQDLANHWRGLRPADDLPQLRDPASGYIATANEPFLTDAPSPIVNAALAPDRRDRIAEILEHTRRVSVSQMAAIQGDLTSLRARRWLAEIGPLLPRSQSGRRLRDWDGVYRGDSREPTRFLRLVAEAMTVAYGGLFARADATPADAEDAPTDGLELPRDRARYWIESNVVADQHPGFEALLLDPDSPLWRGRDRDRVLAEAARRALTGAAAPHRRAQQVRRSWFLLEGSPLGRRVPLPGSLATVLQGRLIRTGGRVVALQPIWRMTADLSEDVIHTAIAGGPSDRPATRLYRSGQGGFSRMTTRTLALPRDWPARPREAMVLLLRSHFPESTGPGRWRYQRWVPVSEPLHPRSPTPRFRPRRPKRVSADSDHRTPTAWRPTAASSRSRPRVRACSSRWTPAPAPRSSSTGTAAAVTCTARPRAPSREAAAPSPTSPRSRAASART
ncbi:MAG: penicillin acylase family protein [Proteobacteria bacterium]|nr:penicillin acylase family protein [Pseudomonadota bacterium]